MAHTIWQVQKYRDRQQYACTGLQRASLSCNAALVLQIKKS
jgi:hypothetical protein